MTAPVIKKKVCMLGASAVGKTSLVRRYVQSVFDEKYHTTIGVKIDQKDIQAEGHEVKLLLWDIEGHDEFQNVRTSFLRGTQGVIFVIDYTRGGTLDTVHSVHDQVQAAIGDVPSILVFNKSDLVADRDISEDVIEAWRQSGWPIIEASAKTGQGVEEAFLLMTQRMLGV